MSGENNRTEYAREYIAPRDDPLQYPGQRPGYSFLLAHTKLFPLHVESGGERKSLAELPVAESQDQDSRRSLANQLELLDVAPMSQRFPVVAYGSNAVPGQLVSKLGNDAVVPVVLGEIAHFQVVYNLISNQGYAFADLARSRNGASSRVAVTFLDETQLGRMLATEQNYRLGYAPVPVAMENGEVIENTRFSGSYVFVGFRPIWVPATRDDPIPVREAQAGASDEHPSSQAATLALVVEEFKLRDKGIHTAAELIQRIREEASLPECPGKLKYKLQRAVATDPRSKKPPAEQIHLADLTSIPARRYGEAR